MNSHHHASRRKDVHREPRLPGQRPDWRRQLIADINRGLRYFWSRPHRVGGEAASQAYFNPP